MKREEGLEPEAAAPASEPWYSVRCVFAFEGTTGGRTNFEERITLWRAESFDAAIAMAERDAVDYAENVGGRYLGLAQSYHLAEASPTSGIEVFSLIRESDLDPDDYMSCFFDTGTEHQRRG